MKGYVSALIPTATIEEFLEIFLAWLFAGMAIIVIGVHTNGSL